MIILRRTLTTDVRIPAVEHWLRCVAVPGIVRDAAVEAQLAVRAVAPAVERSAAVSASEWLLPAATLATYFHQLWYPNRVELQEDECSRCFIL